MLEALNMFQAAYYLSSRTQFALCLWESRSSEVIEKNSLSKYESGTSFTRPMDKDNLRKNKFISDHRNNDE